MPMFCHIMENTTFTGQYYLVLYYPNKFGKEHPVFMPLNYENGKFYTDLCKSVV